MALWGLAKNHNHELAALAGLAGVDQQVVLLTAVHELGRRKESDSLSLAATLEGRCGRTARGPGRSAATGGRPALAAAAKPAGTTATPACSPSRSASLLSWWRGGGARPEGFSCTAANPENQHQNSL